MPDLLALALDAHGGADLWGRLDALHVRLRVRGPILALRGRSPRARALTASLGAHRVWARLDPFPEAGTVGVLDGGEVRIESAAGRVLASRRVVPGTHGPWRWDALDELYFLAYAFWNYGTTPFLLARDDVETDEIAPAHGLRRLRATFPPTLPTHCREQTFAFGTDGLLRRLDYTADVFGKTARAAHLTRAHRTLASSCRRTGASSRGSCTAGPTSRPPSWRGGSTTWRWRRRPRRYAASASGSSSTTSLRRRRRTRADRSRRWARRP